MLEHVYHVKRIIRVSKELLWILALIKMPNNEIRLGRVFWLNMSLWGNLGLIDSFQFFWNLHRRIYINILFSFTYLPIKSTVTFHWCSYKLRLKQWKLLVLSEYWPPYKNLNYFLISIRAAFAAEYRNVLI